LAVFEGATIRRSTLPKGALSRRNGWLAVDQQRNWSLKGQGRAEKMQTPESVRRNEDRSMQTKEVLAGLAALAQETRLAIFHLLVRRGPTGLAAGRIAERLGVPPATLSFHLAQLTHAGLIVPRRASRSLIYSADYSQMDDLIAFLTENCCSRSTDWASACPPTPTQSRNRAATTFAKAKVD
jgi:ArsR family transcriptional regulator